MLIQYHAIIGLIFGVPLINAWPVNSPNSTFISHYDIGKRACTPDMFVRFTPEQAAKKAQMMQLLKDAISIVDGALHSKDKKDRFKSVFPKYFPKKDEPVVRAAFERILGTNPDGCGHPELWFKMVGDDPENKCATRPGLQAVTSQSTTEIVFCDAGLALPSLGEMTCDAVGKRITEDIITGGAVMLHEIFHLSYVGRPVTGTLLYDLVICVKDEKVQALGPKNAKKVCQMGKGKEKGALAKENVENYVFLALEAYYSNLCNKDYGTRKDTMTKVKNTLGVLVPSFETKKKTT